MKYGVLLLAGLVVLVATPIFGRKSGSASADVSGEPTVDKVVNDGEAFLEAPSKETQKMLLEDVQLKPGQSPRCPDHDETIKDADKRKYEELINQIQDRQLKESLLTVVRDGKFTSSECKDLVEKQSAQSSSDSSSDESGSSDEGSSAAAASSLLGLRVLTRRMYGGRRHYGGRRMYRHFAGRDVHDSFRGVMVWCITTSSDKDACIAAKEACVGSWRTPDHHFACVLQCTPEQLKAPDLRTMEIETKIHCTVKGKSGPVGGHCAENSALSAAKDSEFNVLYTTYTPCDRCSGWGKTGKKAKYDQKYEDSLERIDNAAKEGNPEGLWLICASKQYYQTKDTNWNEEKGFSKLGKMGKQKRYLETARKIGAGVVVGV